MNQRVSWRLGPVLALVVSFALCIYGLAQVRFDDGTSLGVGRAAVIVLIPFLILCVATPRGRWVWWQRILFFPVAFLASAIFKPLVIAFGWYAMSKSRLFVEPQRHGDKVEEEAARRETRL